MGMAHRRLADAGWHARDRASLVGLLVAVAVAVALLAPHQGIMQVSIDRRRRQPSWPELG